MVKADAEEIKARAQTLNFIFVVFFITRKCNEGRRKEMDCQDCTRNDLDLELCYLLLCVSGYR